MDASSAELGSEPKPRRAACPPSDDTIEVRLWLEEYAWLHGVLKSGANVCPTFRFPDLISAAVTMSLAQPDGPLRIFRFLGTQFVLRARDASRRRESIWRSQFEQLRELQRSPANRHPHPNFQLDQLATACVAHARLLDESGAQLLRHARLNMAERTRNAGISRDGGTAFRTLVGGTESPPPPDDATPARPRVRASTRPRALP